MAEPYYLHIEVDTCAQAWNEALTKIFKFGAEVGVQSSSSQKVEHALDATAFIVIKDPLNKKGRLARGDLFGHSSIQGTDYVDEVVHGAINHKIGEEVEIEGEKVIPVPYTYHQRITAYPGELPINQLDKLLNYLKLNPGTRRAQVITWVPMEDACSSDPPCLQRIQLRIINNRLHFHVTWRSNDLFKAFGANIYAMVEWAKAMATELEIELGHIVYFCDSLHIYESDWYPDYRGGKPNVTDVLETLDKIGSSYREE